MWGKPAITSRLKGVSGAVLRGLWQFWEACSRFASGVSPFQHRAEGGVMEPETTDGLWGATRPGFLAKAKSWPIPRGIWVQTGAFEALGAIRGKQALAIP